MSHFESSSLFYDSDEAALDELSGADPSLKARLKKAMLQRRAEFEKGSDSSSSSEEDEELKQTMTKKKPIITSAVTRLSVEEKIGHTLSQFGAVFSQVFQAILVLMDEASHHQFSPSEEEKISKRSKEFQVRLKRMNFELKQKVHVTRAATVKLRLSPESSLLASDADGKLYSSLRCSLGLLRSYLAHLPLSGGRLCPDALGAATDSLLGVSELARQLGYEAEEMASDTKRLRAASEKFRKQEPPPKVEEKKKKIVDNKKKHLNLIDNLAREKFGAKFPVAPSPKKSNPNRRFLNKQKVIIPRENAVLRDRRETARRLRSEETPIGATSREEGNKMDHEDEKIACLQGREKGFLDLEDDELEHILRYRSRDGLPCSVICRLSSDVVGEIVSGVAREMMDEKVVQKLLNWELKTS